eukprot:RCo051910
MRKRLPKTSSGNNVPTSVASQGVAPSVVDPCDQAGEIDLPEDVQGLAKPPPAAAFGRPRASSKTAKSRPKIVGHTSRVGQRDDSLQKRASSADNAENAAVVEVLDCLSFLVAPSEVLKNARECYQPSPLPRDPTFSSSAIHRVQARVRALLRGQLSPDIGITQNELSRAELALRMFQVPPAQFASLFIYSEEIEEQNVPVSDQIYTLLTTAQRAAARAPPADHPAYSILRSLRPLTRCIEDYLQGGLIPSVNSKVDVLFRGAGYEVPLEDSGGGAITRHAWNCFSSASLSATAARCFLRPGGTLFVVRSARAKAIFFLSAFIKELECLVPPTEFCIRDALPISILRMMDVQGSVMLLDDPEAAHQGTAAQEGLSRKLFLQQKLHFLFEPMRAKHVPVRATPDREHRQDSYELRTRICERLLAPPPQQGISTELVLSSGGTGKTSTALLIQEKVLSGGGEFGSLVCVFISLPLAGKHLESVSGMARFF